jgi:hypothetical protein
VIHINACCDGNCYLDVESGFRTGGGALFLKKLSREVILLSFEVSRFFSEQSSLEDSMRSRAGTAGLRDFGVSTKGAKFKVELGLEKVIQLENFRPPILNNLSYLALFLEGAQANSTC